MHPLKKIHSRLRQVRLAKLFNDDLYRCVVGWPIPSARRFVDGAGYEAVSYRRGEQEMINANAVIFLPCACLIIPECILSGMTVQCAEGICKPEVYYGAVCFVCLDSKRCVSLPVFRGFAVALIGDNVKITAYKERDIVIT